jgi:hypothetical protein
MEFNRDEAAQALGASHSECKPCKPCEASVDCPQDEAKGEHANPNPKDEVKGEAMPVKTHPEPPLSLVQKAKMAWDNSWWGSRVPFREYVNLTVILGGAKKVVNFPDGTAYFKSYNELNDDIHLVVKDGLRRLVSSKVIAVHVSSGTYCYEDGVSCFRHSNVITEKGSVYCDSYRPIGFCKFGGEPDMNEEWVEYIATLYKD